MDHWFINDIYVKGEFFLLRVINDLDSERPSSEHGRVRQDASVDGVRRGLDRRHVTLAEQEEAAYSLHFLAPEIWGELKVQIQVTRTVMIPEFQTIPMSIKQPPLKQW